MAELGMFGCLLNVHIDLQNSFKTYFLYFHDIKIDLRPKNKETFFFIIPMLPTVYCLRLYSKSFLANVANLEIRKIKTFNPIPTTKKTYVKYHPWAESAHA